MKSAKNGTQVALTPQEDECDQVRDRSADGPLSKYGEAHRDVKEPAPRAAVAPMSEKCEQCDRSKRCEQHVGCEHLRHHSVKRAGGEYHGGEQGAARVKRAEREEVGR